MIDQRLIKQYITWRAKTSVVEVRKVSREELVAAPEQLTLYQYKDGDDGEWHGIHVTYDAIINFLFEKIIHLEQANTQLERDLYGTGCQCNANLP